MHFWSLGESIRRVIVVSFLGVVKCKRRGIRFDSMWITFEESIDFIFIVFFVLL